MDADLEIIVIAAVSKNGVIGKGGKMPWHLPDDLKNFAKLTKGHPVLMGRKTFESIGHPLPQRDNIVLTRDKELKALGCIVVTSLSEAISLASSKGTGKLFIIGGAEIYKAVIQSANVMFLTEVDVEIDGGDAFFPEWNESDWEEVGRFTQSGGGNQFGFTVRELHHVQNIKPAGTGPSANGFCNLDNARNSNQQETMRRINEGGYCPFCGDNLQKNHSKPILFKGAHWLLTENQWPYPAAKRHLLAISIVHAEKLADLPVEAGAELMEIAHYIEKELGINCGAICMRFGNPSGNGASVNHLHFHILEPDPEKSDPLIFWIDKKKPSS